MGEVDQREIVQTTVSSICAIMGACFILGGVTGAFFHHQAATAQLITVCEIEHDLPRSQTCEMVAVVKEDSFDKAARTAAKAIANSMTLERKGEE